MLLQILEYLKSEKAATNQQLSRLFKMELSALEPMLALCVTKGILSLHQNAACKKTCFSCQSLTLYYTYNYGV